MKLSSSLVSLSIILASANAAVTSKRQTNTCEGDLTPFELFGVNESCAEFGNTNIPGEFGTDYTWPAESSIDYFVDTVGFNFFRVPFLLERLAPPATGITGDFDATYLGQLQDIVSYITGKGAYVAFEPHNFFIYDGSTLDAKYTAEDFGTFWANLAKLFVSDDHVIFDLMNEPHDVEATLVAEYMQAAVNAIRAADATQLIFVEGTSWTGAWTWTTSGNSEAFASLSDPLNNTAIQMHQYLDSDGSGTNETCVSSTIGAERLADATAWLQETGHKGFLGEIGAGSNDDCVAAVYGALCSMQQAGGVWLGLSWWAAGPWWDTYFTSIEPPSGTSVSRILPEALEPFL
ncbi:glycoside hydrolase family 5 protein [Cylindrobasidium torrendii FP15055 ss-10]|uniref:cellulase n=1 Tax=Cylindrobasidium torrendii FP15055 ss-10 TaxID=1314674 RepID=A0A0D7BT69_9AGAR|nr:glycoside hydrolase family 5 protein [Cylindrobasidium torrendii FP15055 ss-10]